MLLNHHYCNILRFKTAAGAGRGKVHFEKMPACPRQLRTAGKNTGKKHSYRGKNADEAVLSSITFKFPAARDACLVPPPYLKAEYGLQCDYLLPRWPLGGEVRVLRRDHRPRKLHAAKLGTAYFFVS